MLYLIMVPEYTFYLPDWINYLILFIGGLLIVLNNKLAYYLYNIFFINILVSFLIKIDTFRFSNDNIFTLIILFISTWGFVFFNKDSVKIELGIKKRLKAGHMILIGLIYLLIITIPIAFE